MTSLNYIVMCASEMIGENLTLEVHKLLHNLIKLRHKYRAQYKKIIV